MTREEAFDEVIEAFATVKSEFCSNQGQRDASDRKLLEVLKGLAASPEEIANWAPHLKDK